MKKDFLKLILATLFIFFISTFINVGNSSASSIKESELKQLYDGLIEKNVIDSSSLSFEEWSKGYIAACPVIPLEEVEVVTKISPALISVYGGETV